MEFTIYRKSWRRGSGNPIVGGIEQLGDTQLLNDDNMFCCLGMCSIQHGVNPLTILREAEPSSLDNENIPRRTILWDSRGNNSDLSDEAMDINDDEDLTEEDRERKLTRVFAKRGHVLHFVDRLAPKSWRIAK